MRKPGGGGGIVKKEKVSMARQAKGHVGWLQLVKRKEGILIIVTTPKGDIFRVDE